MISQLSAKRLLKSKRAFSTSHKRAVNIAVAGGAGHISYPTLFRLASGEFLGKHTEINLSILDGPWAQKELDGLLLELQDSAFDNLGKVKVTTNLSEGLKDADYALMIAGHPRRPGMQISDLLSANG